MTTRKEQLLALAERCGAGDESAHTLIREALKYGYIPHVPEAWAYNGNNAELDAVQALHGELLGDEWAFTLNHVHKKYLACLHHKTEPIKRILPAPTLALAWLGCLCLVLAEKET